MTAYIPHSSRTFEDAAIGVAVISASPDRAAQVAHLVERRSQRVEIIVGDIYARTALSRTNPDLIIADLDLLACGTDSLMSWLRAHQPLAPVIILAGPEQMADAVNTLNEGAVACLRTPVDDFELHAVILRALENRRWRKAAWDTMFEAQRAASDARTELLTMRQVMEELFMVYQPVYWANNGQVAGVEALVRSSHAAGPNAFSILGLAESTSQQDALDQRIFSAIQQDVERTRCPHALLVNVSVQALLRGTLGRTGDPLLGMAHRTILEVSEDGHIPDREALQAEVGRLREIGFRFAVDDIGTGCDYLARVLTIQPEIYKLDRLALSGCDTDERKRRYVRSIVDLAHGEGSLVVAEGIERPEEKQVASDLGCDLLQGYLLAMPSRRL